jgi:hypothetical protein
VLLSVEGGDAAYLGWIAAEWERRFETCHRP